MKSLLCLVMLLSAAAAVRDLTGKMFTFPRDRLGSHVEMIPSVKKFTAFTVCYRVFTDGKIFPFPFSLSTRKNDFQFRTIWNGYRGELTIYTCKGCRVYYRKIGNFNNKWLSKCLTLDTNGMVQLWLDGKALARKKIHIKSICEPKMILGTVKHRRRGGFRMRHSFVGSVTDLHMWNRALPHTEVRGYMTGNITTPGNMLNWGALNFKEKGKVFIKDQAPGRMYADAIKTSDCQA